MRILTFEASTLPLLSPIPPLRASPEVVSWQPAFRHPDPLSQRQLLKWVIAPVASRCPRTFWGGGDGRLGSLLGICFLDLEAWEESAL